MFDFAPALLGVSHLVWGLACIFLHPETASPDAGIPVLLPVALVLLIDAIAFGLMWFRERLGLSPRTLSRALCAYIGVSGALWMSYGILLNSDHHATNVHGEYHESSV